MKATAVILADASRARLFEVQKAPGQAGEPEPRLVEIRDLVQPGRRGRPSENLADTRPGSHGVVRGPGHAVDDHRDAKTEEGDRKFAGEIVSSVAALCGERSIARLLVVAPPRFAGHLRERDVAGACETVDIVTLDLSALTPPRALEQLTRAGHLEG